MFHAQCLEYGLVLLLSAKYGPSPEKINIVQYDELMQTNLLKTFGALKKDLPKLAKFPDGFEDKLTEALKKRNWLAHHYFRERASQFINKKGREQMIQELQTIADLFVYIDEQFTDINFKWGAEHGLTEETFQKLLDEL
jgi:hypothetical protein